MSSLHIESVHHFIVNDIGLCSDIDITCSTPPGRQRYLIEFKIMIFLFQFQLLFIAKLTIMDSKLDYKYKEKYWNTRVFEIFTESYFHWIFLITYNEIKCFNLKGVWYFSGRLESLSNIIKSNLFQIRYRYAFTSVVNQEQAYV